MTVYEETKRRWNDIAKPLGSFGVLEEIWQRIAAIQGTPTPDISERTAVVMCGDHGVVEEGVTQCGSEVTAECAAAIAAGRSNINAIAKQCNMNVIAVDMGMITDCPGILNRKTAHSTRNITKGEAMTVMQAEYAITAGIDVVRDLSEKGVKLIVSGEMGIGNTTPASAIASVLLGIDAEKVTGRGAGLDSEGLNRKIAAVRKAVSVSSPPPGNAFEVLRCLGGFEIAGMTGLFLGGAVYRIPVIVDGVISAAAAAIACGIAPLSAEYMIASHCSGEPASEGLLKRCGLKPVINAGLRLGEGTGAALMVPLLDCTAALYNNAHRFNETSIERYKELK